MKCPLCAHDANHFYSENLREYFFCTQCFSVFLNPKNYLDPDAEKAHYERHNNDVEDLAYQQFVRDLVDEVKNDFSKGHSGLDYGSGTGPVVSKLLGEEGYRIKQFDPFFENKPEVFKKKYDFIVCCEVVEHFHHPAEEFERLFNLLKKGGKLYCKTELYSEKNNFSNWYYKNDPTHVFFYHIKSVDWIKTHFGFKKAEIKNRLVILSK